MMMLEERIVPSYFPATTSGIHVFEDQLPNLSSALVQFLATHTDGTQKQTATQIAQLRAVNPNFTVLHYQLGSGNSPYDYIINNNWSSDWSYVNPQESWFAHQSDSGEPQTAADLSSGRVGNSTGWDQADIANPNWEQYTANQVFQNMAATGSNGWFADSFTYGISSGGYDNPVPTRYQGTNAANPASWPGGITWTTQLANWAQTIETAFTQHNAAYGTSYKFLPNLDALVTSWEPNWYDNASGVPIMDGAFLESFGHYNDTYNWTLSMNRGLNFTTNGKIVIMQPYLDDSPDSATGQQQRNFYLGTYLLLKGNETYFNMEYGSSPQYYPEYQLNLGAATTPLPSNVSSYLWNGVYRRDFQNGFVLVNPGSTTYTLNLGGAYQEVQGHGGGPLDDTQLDASGNYIGGSLTYQSLSSITLAGGTAAIFLRPTINPVGPSFVVADFPGSGVWRHSDSTGWKQLSPADAGLVVVDDNGNVAAGFANGLWRYEDAGGWQRLTPAAASLIDIAGSGIVVAEFPGNGLWRYGDPAFAGGGWQQLTPANALSIGVDAQGDTVGSFAGNGVYFYRDTGGWQQLTAAVATQVSLAASGSSLAAAFQGGGVWRYGLPGSSGIALGWQQVTSASATALAIDAAGDILCELINGLWLYPDTSSGQQLTSALASQVGLASNGEVFAEFPRSGVWEYVGAWQQLTPADAKWLG
jgi:hypothetical protein